MIQATNNFVFIIRDEAERKAGDFIIPGQAEKPHHGIIISVGNMVQDKNIKKGKKALFHKGVGFEIPYEDKVFLVMEGERIIGIE